MENQEQSAKTEQVKKPEQAPKSKDAPGQQEKPTAKPKISVANNKTPKRSRRRRVSRGQVHIKCSYNNTIVAISDLNGAILGWASAGSLGFKGAKKATPYAATVVSDRAVENVSRYGLKEVDVFVRGVGAGREGAIRALGNNGLKVNLIKDITPVPHNGVRAKKPRRV
ncbi:MAG: 30S ribosomal protein S11 [Candidatus Moranbacteria bacterium]|nr:30S ribosomal protein S11 [Candidatus Moranbacteria bacterium]